MKRVNKVKQEKVKKSKITPKYEDMSLSDDESTVVAGISAALAVPVPQQNPAPAEIPVEDEEAQNEETESPEEMAMLDQRLKVLESKEGEKAVPVPTIPMEDYMKLRKRVKLLEGKFKRAHSLSEYVTPLEVVDVAGKRQNSDGN